MAFYGFGGRPRPARAGRAIESTSFWRNTFSGASVLPCMDHLPTVPGVLVFCAASRGVLDGAPLAARPRSTRCNKHPRKHLHKHLDMQNYGEAFITMAGRPGPPPKSKWKIFIDFVPGPSAVIFARCPAHSTLGTRRATLAALNQYISNTASPHLRSILIFAPF